MRAQVIEDAHRCDLPALEQSPVAAQHAQLQREMAAVFVAPALRRLAPVGFRQGPVARQFFLARILGQQDAAPASRRRIPGRAHSLPAFFHVRGQIFRRGAGVNRSRVERFMAEQRRQFDQLAGMAAQKPTGEGVPQRMRRHGETRDPGPARQIGNRGLHRPQGKRLSPAFAEKQMILRTRGLPAFQIELQRAPSRRVQRHLALLSAFSLPHQDHARAVVQIDVADVKIRRLADTQTRFQQHSIRA